MELATLRTLYFANLYRERALKCRVAEIVRAVETGADRASTPGRDT